MDTKTKEASLYAYLKGKLSFSDVVTDESMQKQMYETYQRQMREKGVEPVEFDRIVFLASGMASRDDDLDFSPADVIREAKDVWGFLLKNHDTKLDTVVVSIGLEPVLHVEDFSSVQIYERAH